MKISIITINYNNLDGLKKTMTSVLEQTYANVEYIIIDGGSTDGSKRYIESCQQDLAYWVSESDRGIYNAMNKGIAQATGEYLLFLNSGDWLAGVKVLDLISKNLGNCGILYGNLIKVYANGSEKVDKGPESSQLTLFHFFDGTINHPSAFIKRDLFKSYGSYDESLKIVSDWKFFLISIGLNETVVKYVDLEICHFDMSGLSNVNIKGRNEERNIVLKNELSLKTFNDYSRFSEIAKTVNNPRVQMLLKSEHSTLARKLNIKWFRLISILLKKKG